MSDEMEMRFDFIKSAGCREVIIDGVYGGPGPGGRINAVLFAERNHIPASVTHRIDADGTTQEEITEKRELKAGTVRVIETILMVNLEAAKALHKFLGEQIKSIDK